MINILVTGGAGFIGSHTCLSLLQNGYEVFVIDSLINGYRKSLVRVDEIYKSNKKSNNNLHFICADLRDLKSLSRIFKKFKSQGIHFQGVIHFAGLKSVEDSINNPTQYWENNVFGTLNLLKVLDFNKCKSFIFSSSATVYGLNHDSPISEDCYANPINPYGDTKLAVEKILRSVYESKNRSINIANLRYFNPIGAHDSFLIGEHPKGIPNNLFPFICQVASKKREGLNIFGNDYPTRDGTCIRDYIHVMDLSEGHIRTMNYLLENDSCFFTINLGTGKGTSVLELKNIFEEVNKVSINYSFLERRNGDVACMFADVSKARELIGWHAEKDVYDMCKDGWNWQLNNPNGY